MTTVTVSSGEQQDGREASPNYLQCSSFFPALASFECDRTSHLELEKPYTQLPNRIKTKTVPSTHFTTATGLSPNFGRAASPANPFPLPP